MTTAQVTQTESIVYHILVLFHDIPHYSHTLGIFTDLERTQRLKDEIQSAISTKSNLGKYKVCLEVISVYQDDLDQVLHKDYEDYVLNNPAKDTFMELALRAPDSWFGNLRQSDLEFQEKANSMVVCYKDNTKGTQTHQPVMNVVTHVSRNMVKCVVVGMFTSTLTAQRVQESLLYHYDLDLRFSSYDEKNFVELESFYRIDPEYVQPDYVGLKHLFTA